MHRPTYIITSDLDFISEDELYHYGVKGMRWGHRNVRAASDGIYNAHKRTQAAKLAMEKASANKKSAQKNFNKAYRNSNSLILRSQFDKNLNKQLDKNLMATANKSYKADKQYKNAKKTYKTLAKIEKQTYKEAVKKRAKEIQKGASAVEKIWNTITNSHKYQAQIEVNLDRRGY